MGMTYSVCPNCGNKIKPGQIFCVMCGVMVSYDDGWEVERYVFEYELERDTLTLNLEGSDDEFTLVKENNSL